MKEQIKEIDDPDWHDEDADYWGELRKYVDSGGQMQDNWPDYHKHNFAEMKRCDERDEQRDDDDPRWRGLNNG